VVVGNVVPLVGVMAIVYVAVPPGGTVCDEPSPPPLGTGVTAKLMTLCVSTLLEDAAKFASPPYAAVIECEPIARDEVVKLATPAERELGPSGVVPSRKLTLPVGVPDAELTVAVNVIALCVRAGLLLVTSASEVDVLLTTDCTTVIE